MNKPLTHRQKDLLLEAWRRWLCFARGKGLLEAWTGLGCIGEYKYVVDAGLMEWVNQPRPRCQGWLRLTPAGVEALRGILAQKYAPHCLLINYP